MKRFIQLPVLLVLAATTGLIACNNFGKKIKIIGTKGEVYYKDGATESEAKKVGDLLKESGFLGSEKEASVQVAKENGEYTVRFVYDKKYYDENKDLDDAFRQLGAKLSGEVFDGEKVNIALADNHFRDFKTIPFDNTTVKKEEKKIENPGAPPGEEISKDEYNHDKQGDVTFYWKGISDQESKFIADYIVKTGEFTGGTAEIYMMKEGDRYILKFPVKEEYRNDQPTIDEVEKVSRKIKDNVFPNNSYSFQMTDEKLTAIKSFDY
jgi:predicted small secreted protein